MIKFQEDKSSRISFYLIISFIISTCTFSLLYSSLFAPFKNVMEENKFNSDYHTILISPKDEKSTTYKKINRVISNNITNNFTLGISTDVIDNGSRYGRTNKIIAAGKDFDITRYGTIDGRTLSKDELNGTKKLAVVGQSIRNDIIEENKKKYLYIQKEKYEVVGIINDSIFFNYSSIVPYKTLPSNDYAAPIYSYLINKSSLNKISVIDQNKYHIAEQPYKKKNPFVNVIANTELVQICILQFICGVVNLALFSVFYSADMRKKAAIMRVVGAKRIHVFKFLLCDIVKKSTVGIIFGIILSKPLIQYIQKIYSDWIINLDIYNIISSSIVCYTIAIGISLCIMHRVMKFKVLKEVR